MTEMIGISFFRRIFIGKKSCSVNEKLSMEGNPHSLLEGIKENTQVFNDAAKYFERTVQELASIDGMGDKIFKKEE